jgi:hypothetical protein
MAIRASIIAAGCAALLLGCAGSAPKQSPVQPRAASCALPGTEAATCFKKSGKLICPVYVFASKNNDGVVFPYVLHVPRGKEATIVWRLLDPDAGFDDADGPQNVKSDTGSDDGEFDGNGTTADADGQPGHGGRANNYGTHYKNTKAGKKYSYTLAFKNSLGAPVSCDPTIVNDAD